MRLIRRASLLVAFHLLTSAATAAAECAWVLWDHGFASVRGVQRNFGSSATRSTRSPVVRNTRV